MMKQSTLLEEGLDREPFDWVLRMALADAYEEEGDDSLSRYYRWTAANRKSPTKANGERWYWMSMDSEWPNTPKPWVLGDLWAEVNYGVTQECTLRTYVLRAHAEGHLRIVLERHDYKVEPYLVIDTPETTYWKHWFSKRVVM